MTDVDLFIGGIEDTDNAEPFTSGLPGAGAAWLLDYGETLQQVHLESDINWANHHDGILCIKR